MLENLENLFIAIVSNVNALALNDAALATFNDVLAGTKASGTAIITAQWIFVAFMLWLTCFAGLQLGKLVDRLDIKMYDDLEKKGIENCKPDLLRHSTIKRIFKEGTEAFSSTKDISEFEDVLLEKNNAFRLASYYNDID